MKFVSKPAPNEALVQCSAQGQFRATVQEPTERGYVPVTLHSVGPVRPLASPRDAEDDPGRQMLIQHKSLPISQN